MRCNYHHARNTTSHHSTPHHITHTTHVCNNERCDSGIECGRASELLLLDCAAGAGFDAHNSRTSHDTTLDNASTLLISQTQATARAHERCDSGIERGLSSELLLLHCAAGAGFDALDVARNT